MYKEFFYVYSKNKKPKITFKNEQLNNDQVIIDKGYFCGFCEHHMIPFFGNNYFLHMFQIKVLLDKIFRVIDYFDSKLQLQERLTTEFPKIYTKN